MIFVFFALMAMTAHLHQSTGVEADIRIISFQIDKLCMLSNGDVDIMALDGYKYCDIYKSFISHFYAKDLPDLSCIRVVRFSSPRFC